MIVVADSSPLIVLVNIGHIQILPTLFREVVIPPQIAAGLADSKRPQTVQDFIREKPVWLRVQAPASVESMPELHERRARGHLPGETSCTPISCSSTKATAGPRRSRGTWQYRTIGILQRAAEQDLLDLAEAFARIKQTDFWISPRLLDAELERYREREMGRKR